MDKLRAVIFDLDGVIVDTAKYHYMAWKDLAASIGIEVDMTFNEELKGISRMESLDKILALGSALDRYTSEEKIEMASKKNELYKSLIASISSDEILDGIHDLLDELRGRDIAIALASASQNGPFILDRLGLTDYFGCIVDPRQVENPKPAPDIFEMAAEGLGIDCKECIAIEDSIAGIKAINDAGIISIGVGSKSVLDEAAYCFESTSMLNMRLLELCYRY